LAATLKTPGKRPENDPGTTPEEEEEEEDLKVQGIWGFFNSKFN